MTYPCNGNLYRTREFFISWVVGTPRKVVKLRKMQNWVQSILAFVEFYHLILSLEDCMFMLVCIYTKNLLKDDKQQKILINDGYLLGISVETEVEWE